MFVLFPILIIFFVTQWINVVPFSALITIFSLWMGHQNFNVFCNLRVIGVCYTSMTLLIFCMVIGWLHTAGCEVTPSSQSRGFDSGCFGVCHSPDTKPRWVSAGPKDCWTQESVHSLPGYEQSIKTSVSTNYEALTRMIICKCMCFLQVLSFFLCFYVFHGFENLLCIASILKKKLNWGF